MGGCGLGGLPGRGRERRRDEPGEVVGDGGVAMFGMFV